MISKAKLEEIFARFAAARGGVTPLGELHVSSALAELIVEEQEKYAGIRTATGELVNAIPSAPDPKPVAADANAENYTAAINEKADREGVHPHADPELRSDLTNPVRPGEYADRTAARAPEIPLGEPTPDPDREPDNKPLISGD